MTVERLSRPTAAELDALTDLWEASVRATHDFLAPEDIRFYRRSVREEALGAVTLHVLRDGNGAFAAVAGTAGNQLEMLFVAPQQFGQGLGRCSSNTSRGTAAYGGSTSTNRTSGPRLSTPGSGSAPFPATPATLRANPTPSCIPN